jgi:hypothetical protein
MTGDIFLLEGGYLIIIEAGEIIIVLVVKSHMIDAEIKILAITVTPHRRLVSSRVFTTLQLHSVALRDSSSAFLALRGLMRILSNMSEFEAMFHVFMCVRIANELQRA